jgi:cytochrome c
VEGRRVGGVSADFSFTLNNALPRPSGARCVGVEASESCRGDTLGPGDRPALWGPSSFNGAAGMAKAPTLAAFVRANMPFSSGGSLSWADARDLAAYITSQCRPSKRVGPESATCPP